MSKEYKYEVPRSVFLYSNTFKKSIGTFAPCTQSTPSGNNNHAKPALSANYTYIGHRHVLEQLQHDRFFSILTHTMPSNKSAQTLSDDASMMTKSSTSSTAQLLKSKIFPKRNSSTSSSTSEKQLSPGEKQAQRRASRMNIETLAMYTSLK